MNLISFRNTNTSSVVVIEWMMPWLPRKIRKKEMKKTNELNFF